MAVNLMKSLQLGAIMGVATPFVLRGINTVAGFIPGLEVDLQSIAISGDITSNFGVGASTYVQKLFGFLPFQFVGQDLIMAAVTGAVFVTAGAYLADAAGFLKGSKMERVRNSLIAGGLVGGIVANLGLSAFSIPLLFHLVIDAVILAWIWNQIQKVAGVDLTP